VRRRSSGGRDGDGDGDGEEADDDEVEQVTAPAKRAVKPAPAAATAASAVPGHRFVLDAGNRKVETTLYLDGGTLRMDSRETYATPDAATKAFERLKRMLAGEGYKAG